MFVEYYKNEIIITRRNQQSQECNDTRRYFLVTRHFDLWLFDHKINGFPAPIVEHLCVYFLMILAASVFTARRYAVVVCPSVRLYVRPSVTSRHYQNG